MSSAPFIYYFLVEDVIRPSTIQNEKHVAITSLWSKMAQLILTRETISHTDCFSKSLRPIWSKRGKNRSDRLNPLALFPSLLVLWIFFGRQGNGESKKRRLRRMQIVLLVVCRVFGFPAFDLIEREAEELEFLLSQYSIYVYINRYRSKQEKEETKRGRQDKRRADPTAIHS